MGFWYGAWILCVLYSFGEYLPFSQYLSVVPGMNLIRVPPRSLFLSGFSGIVIFAHTLSIWMEDRGSSQKAKILNLVLAGLGFFLIFFGVAVFIATGSLSANVLWGTIAWIGGIGIGLWHSKYKSHTPISFAFHYRCSGSNRLFRIKSCHVGLSFL